MILSPGCMKKKKKKEKQQEKSNVHFSWAKLFEMIMKRIAIINGFLDQKVRGAKDI